MLSFSTSLSTFGGEIYYLTMMKVYILSSECFNIYNIFWRGGVKTITIFYPYLQAGTDLIVHLLYISVFTFVFQFIEVDDV